MREKRRCKWLLRLMLVLIDVLAIAVGFWFAYLVRFETSLFPGYVGFGEGAEGPLRFYLQLFVLILPVYLLIFFFLKLYELNYPLWKGGFSFQIVNALSLGVIVIIIGSFLFREHSISRIWLILNWIFSILSVSLGRLLFAYSVRQVTRRGIVSNRTLIIGTGREAEVLVQQLQRASSSGINIIIGYAVGNPSANLVKIPVLSRVITLTDLPDIIARYQIDRLLIISGAFSQESLNDVIRKVGRSPVDVYVSPGVKEIIASSRMTLSMIAGIPFVGIRGVPLSGTALVFKRVLAFVGSTSLLLILVPVFLIVALLIKLDSRGPVFYIQERVGKGGKIFGMYKFRTMIQGAHKMQGELRKESDVDGPIFKIKDDPRITRVGRWLRRLSLDELPQLINVFKGEMTLVGPRPLPVSDGKEADRDGDWWRRRLKVTPGITGLWQIRGRSDLSFEDMGKLDIFYIENWSLALDFSILLRTIPAVLSGKGAY